MLRMNNCIIKITGKSTKKIKKKKPVILKILRIFSLHLGNKNIYLQMPSI